MLKDMLRRLINWRIIIIIIIIIIIGPGYHTLHARTEIKLQFACFGTYCVSVSLLPSIFVRVPIFYVRHSVYIMPHKAARSRYAQPVRQRIDFKVMVLVYKSLHRLAQPYLSDDCQLVTDVGRRHLRSADIHTCTVLRTQSRLGDRSFGIAGPRLWNSLPGACWTAAATHFPHRV